MGRQWNVLFDGDQHLRLLPRTRRTWMLYKPELGMAAGARTSNALKYTLATPDRKWVGTRSIHLGRTIPSVCKTWV